MKWLAVVTMLLLLPMVMAEEKIISGSVETTTGECRAHIITTVEGSTATQELDCNASTSVTYPIQIKKDLTCTEGTIKKCDEQLHNLTTFMSIFGNAYNHTISEEFTHCIQTRETNQQLATKLSYVNESVTQCDTDKKNLESNCTATVLENKQLINNLASCRSTPKNCDEEINTLKKETKNENWLWFGGGALLGALICYIVFLKKDLAKNPGEGLAGR